MEHVCAAFAFVWFGMVVAISFIEAPVKFSAPGVTIPIGLGIGRLVFRALNLSEVVLAVGLLVTIVVGRAGALLTAFVVVALVVLAGQLGVIRPRLNRRTDLVLAAPPGTELPRSRAHLAYVVTEVLKVVAVLGAGIIASTG